MTDCEHPAPESLPFCWCRTCGFYLDGKRVGDATNETLREVLAGCAYDFTVDYLRRRQTSKVVDGVVVTPGASDPKKRG